MRKYRKCINIILVFIIAFMISFSSCELMEEDVSTENNVLLTGVFTEKMIALADTFSITGSMVFDNNSLYVMGIMEKAVDDRYPAIAVLDTITMDISYDYLPVGGYDAFAVLDEHYLLCSCIYDEDSNVNVYKIMEVSSQDGVVVWENTLSDMDIVPTDFYGEVHLIGNESNWYIGVGNTVITLSADGKIQHIEELPGDILELKKDSVDKLHVLGGDYHMIIDNSGVLSNAEQVKESDIYFIADYDYCYTNDNGLYGHVLGSESDIEIMNWTNSGIVYSRGVRELEVVSPKIIYIYGSDGIGGKTGLWKYTKSDDIELTDVEAIHVTYIEDGRNHIPLAAVKYNAAQTNYRIILNEFSSSNSDGDLMDSFDKAVLDESIGDIVVTQDFDSLRKYGEKGVFTDLYSFFDNNMPIDDIFGCVRQACEINGKLYGIPREFSLETYVAKTDIDSKTWNIDAFIDYASSIKDGSRALLYMTQNDVYYALRDSVISECINLKNHNCSFNSDTFRKFLMYIASLPKENTEDLDWSENNYINGKVSLYAADISSYASYYQAKSVFGEEANATIIGYPSAEGGAAKLKTDAFYSIAEKSKVKEEAMVFIRYLLSADCVIDEARGMRSIPSLKTTAKAWDESEGKMYYFFYYDNVGQWSADNKPITSRDEGAPGVSIQLTQGRIDEVYDFLDKVQAYPYIPTTIATIVDEDVDAFMSGAKTVDETAKIIQSRVSTYLSEKE